MNKFVKKIKHLIRKNKGKLSTYTGVYHTWSEAKSNSTQGQAYANKKYDKRSLRKFTVDEKYTSGRNMIIPIVLATIKNKHRVILDIGGGVNSIFSHLSTTQKKINSCYVLEREEVSSKFNKIVPEKYKGNLKYISSINDIPYNNLDIVYFGSSIQYIKEYKELILNLVKLRPQIIIFSESIFSQLPDDIWVLQQNMGSNIFPNLFVAEEKFIAFMDNLGYSCTLNIESPINKPDGHSHSQIPRDQYKCKTLIFKQTH